MNNFFKKGLIFLLTLGIIISSTTPSVFAQTNQPKMSIPICADNEVITQISFVNACFALGEPPVASKPAEILASFMPTPTILPAHSLKTGPRLNALYLFNLVNAYRKKVKLTEFKPNEQLCQIAVSRLPELAAEIYGGRGMHSGFQKREISKTATENLISFHTEEEALNWWLNSYVHRNAIEGDYKYSCVACKDNNCTELFTNIEPRKEEILQANRG